MKNQDVMDLVKHYANHDTDVVKNMFDDVIVDGQSLSLFMRNVRSGKFGRRSFGSTVKKLIQKWITNKSIGELNETFKNVKNPNLRDVIRMVHPKPVDKITQNGYRYFLGLSYDKKLLPETMRNEHI